MGWQIDKRDYDHVTIQSHQLNDSEFMIVDAQEGQCSLNWTTRVRPHDFLNYWRGVGDKSRVLILTTPDAKPIEGYLYRFLELRSIGELSRLRISLCRIWLHDASVIWQHLGTTGTKAISIAGVASPYFDEDGILRYLEATATEGIKLHAREMISTSADDIIMAPHATIQSLVYANFDQKE